MKPLRFGGVSGLLKVTQLGATGSGKSNTRAGGRSRNEAVGFRLALPLSQSRGLEVLGKTLG